VLFAVVAAPWYVAMWWRHGSEYLAGFFLGDNLERFATDRFNEPRPWWYYGPVVVGGLVPWAPFLLLGLGTTGRMATGRGGAGSLETRLALWVVIPLVLLSISVGKQPRYVLPLLPPLALLVAHGIVERTRARRGLDGGLYRQAPDRLLQAGALLAGLVLALAGGLVWRSQPLYAGVPGWHTLAAAAITIAGSVAVIGVALSRWWRHAPWVLAWATAAAMPALMIGTLGGGPDETVRQVARAVAAARRGDEPLGVSRVFVRNLVFYTGTRQTDLIDDEQLAAFLRQEGRALVVVPADVLARVEAAGVPAPIRLAEFRYFNEAGLRLRSILTPDPERDVQRVLLVATRP
jgi:4-amino-4-deoxy-L-arabinose transferase-like glycosyltransferase